MQQKENTVEKTQPSVNEQVTQCTRGNEILSNRDLVAYLRSIEEGAELPPAVDVHVKSCRACAENWKFVQETDPVLRKLRKERIQLIIRTVVAEENPPLPDTPRAGLTDDQHKQAVQQVTAALSPANAVVQEALALASSLPNPSYVALAVSSKIVDIQAKIRAIANEQERERTTRSVCSTFKARFGSEGEGEFTTAVLNHMGTLRQSGEKCFDLSALTGVPLDVATAIFTSFPATFLYPGLLEKKDNKICLDMERFHQLQTQAVPIGGLA